MPNSFPTALLGLHFPKSIDFAAMFVMLFSKTEGFQMVFFTVRSLTEFKTGGDMKCGTLMEKKLVCFVSIINPGRYSKKQNTRTEENTDENDDFTMMNLIMFLLRRTYGEPDFASHLMSEQILCQFEATWEFINV